jgi:hypothetical protein
MTLMNGFRWSKTEEYFRENYTHVSDPAPKAAPPDPEARVHLETGISRVGGKLRCDPEECHKRQTFLVRERDAALSRIAELEARQLNTDAGMNTLRKQYEELEAENARAKSSVLRELEALAQTHKWVAAGEFSKEAAWGRAYGRAMVELRLKYDAPPSPVEGGS